MVNNVETIRLKHVIEVDSMTAGISSSNIEQIAMQNLHDQLIKELTNWIKIEKHERLNPIKYTKDIMYTLSMKVLDPNTTLSNIVTTQPLNTSPMWNGTSASIGAVSSSVYNKSQIGYNNFRVAEYYKDQKVSRVELQFREDEGERWQSIQRVKLQED